MSNSPNRYVSTQPLHRAVLLDDDEAKLFPAAIQYSDERLWVLPYVDGKCPYLGDDDRCTIYAQRPVGWQEFNCRAAYFSQQNGTQHAWFLLDNPHVIELIEKYPTGETDK